MQCSREFQQRRTESGLQAHTGETTYRVALLLVKPLRPARNISPAFSLSFSLHPLRPVPH